MKFSAQASPALVLFAVILSVLTGPSRSQAQDDAAVTEIVRQFNEIEEMLPRMETLFIDASHAESDLGIGAITVWFDPQTLYTKVRNGRNLQLSGVPHETGSLSTSPRRVEPFRSRRDEVAAMNQSNHFFRWLASVVFAVSLSLSSDAEDRVALIIGIDDYQSEEIPDLEGAIRDARLMSDSLKQISPSFEVQLLENPSLDDVFDAIEQFGVSARRAQCALFYFAGHGIEFHGENFLLTGDSSISDNIETGVEATKRRLRRKMLSLNVVMDEIELTQADLKLLVLDACRNNPIEINEGGKTRSLGGTRGLARVSAPLGMLVSYSADAGQVANDGLFTEVLAKNLIEPKLSVMEVFAKTRDEVSAISKQRKEENNRYHLQLPAEYNKLGWAGIKFVFQPGDHAYSPQANDSIGAIHATFDARKSEAAGKQHRHRSALERLRQFPGNSNGQYFRGNLHHGRPGRRRRSE